MFAIIGIVVVFGAIAGGYLMEHGKLMVLMQPAELVIIFGAAIGTLLIANPLPVLTSVSPSPVASKGSNFLLTVTGSKFIRGAVVQWNGVTRTTKWVSATKLVADIQASEIKAARTAKITVVNPGPGGGPSSSLSLTIQ